MIKIYMGIPSTGDRTDAQNYTLRRIAKRYADKVELVYPDQFVGRIFHDYARNEYIKQFLSSDCDMIWFLDSDIVPPDNILDILFTDKDWKLAGAPYPVWMTPAGGESQAIVFTTYCKDKGTGKFFSSNVPLEGTSYVDGIATGCIFIKREVLEKLKQPYFEFKYNQDSREIIEGEDIGFCKKVSELGYQFYIDFSMACHHYKKLSLLDVSNFIMQQQKQTILSCDRQIRQILAKVQLNKIKKEQKSKIITT